MTLVIRAPTLNRGLTAPTALLFYVDGVPGLDGDPFAACAALHSLCCLFLWLRCLAPPMLSLPFGYSALRRLCWLSCVGCVGCGLALFSNGVFRVRVRINRLWFIE
jgi:hypothetical protein